MIVNQGEQNSSDLAIVLTGAARVVADRLAAAVREAGIDDMRSSFGFVLRALAERDLTLTELASGLDVSKQAAIKVVDEMEARGFLAREPDPGDRRRKLLTITARGRAVREAALAASEEMERELRAEVGDADVEAMRRALLAFLARHGVEADAAAGRSRALW
jgi:DNA-binding MarR family transcriptional regulator